MASNVERISSLPPSVTQPSQGPAAEPAAPAPNLAANDYRLVIEQDKDTGSYVYKTLDRTTGEVVRQLPREEMLRLKESPAYVAGQVIQTEA